MTKSKPFQPGQVIESIRKAKGLTRAQLANACRLFPNIIKCIETGKLPLTLERAERIALALEVHPGLIAFPNAEIKALRICVVDSSSYIN